MADVLSFDTYIRLIIILHYSNTFCLCFVKGRLPASRLIYIRLIYMPDIRFHLFYIVAYIISRNHNIDHI